jgi:putative spermidine/putrescine transport system permease protein
MSALFWRYRAAYLLALPLFLFLVALFIVPVGQMLLLSLYPDGKGPTLSTFSDIIVDPYYQRIALRTLRISFFTTLLTLVLAYPVAIHLRNVGPTWRSRIILIMVSPLLTSVVVRTLAWVVLLSSSGILSQAFSAVGLPPMRLIYVEGAVVVGLTHVFFGYMVVSLMTAMQRIDANLYTAAANLGASRWRQHLEVTLPLSLPGVLSGSLLVFILAASSYATPSLLGGLRISILAMEVYDKAITNLNWPVAAAISVLLCIVIAIIVLVVTRVAEGGKRKVIFQ